MKLRVFTNLEDIFLGLECGSSLPEVFLMEMWRYVAVNILCHSLHRGGQTERMKVLLRIREVIS